TNASVIASTDATSSTTVSCPPLAAAPCAAALTHARIVSSCRRSYPLKALSLEVAADDHRHVHDVERLTAADELAHSERTLHASRRRLLLTPVEDNLGVVVREALGVGGDDDPKAGGEQPC